MTEIAAFTNMPTCVKCGEERFSWRLVPADRWHYHPEDAGETRWTALAAEHLDLTCSRCGWQFNMRTKDEGMR